MKLKIRDRWTHKNNKSGMVYPSQKIGTCCHNFGLGCYVTESYRLWDFVLGKERLWEALLQKMGTSCHMQGVNIQGGSVPYRAKQLN
jgi:hypothetical protein